MKKATIWSIFALLICLFWSIFAKHALGLGAMAGARVQAHPRLVLTLTTESAMDNLKHGWRLGRAFGLMVAAGQCLQTNSQVPGA